VETATHLEALEVEGSRLAAAAAVAGLSATVPSCPGWTVRELLGHLGSVHRWATHYVDQQLREMVPEQPEEEMLRAGPDGDQLLSWFRDGHARLVAALAAAPTDLQCWTFLPAPSARAFWSRRQAHETTVHRADAELAAGVAPVVDAPLAHDGIDEVLLGFGSHAVRNLTWPAPATLALMTADTAGAWSVRFGPASSTVQRGADRRADCTATAGASELYLMLWHRLPESAASVEGDTRLLTRWLDHLHITWS
jgi:uncharacterized protein (TIGR03083 family)